MLRNLYIRKGYRIAVLNPPVGYSQLLGQLPDDVSVSNSLEGDFDLIQTFLMKRTSLEKELHVLRDSLKPGGLLWVSYPKGNQLKADINRDTIAAYAKTVGLKAVAQISVDNVWSALRLKVVLSGKKVQVTDLSGNQIINS
ncbi:DUF3052 domain-containing protein [Acidobacteria bacterium AH-259-A15]|nr:DUF3052 domain-containing protein [Acidobacteria bacterium AH-259-A15]